MVSDYRQERNLAHRLIEEATERMSGERSPWVLLEAVREVLRLVRAQGALSPDVDDDVQYAMASLRSLGEMLWRDDVVVRGHKPF
jgi:hypothetical protein